MKCTVYCQPLSSELYVTTEAEKLFTQYSCCPLSYGTTGHWGIHDSPWVSMRPIHADTVPAAHWWTCCTKTTIETSMPYLPRLAIKPATKAGPKPFPRSSVMLCQASATPLVSGSFTFSSMALFSGPAVPLSMPVIIAGNRMKRNGWAVKSAFNSHHMGKAAEATLVPQNSGMDALLTVLYSHWPR